jgi:antitoxin component of RelBE/YafQ-DinJ toxin-antitoxin module
MDQAVPRTPTGEIIDQAAPQTPAAAAPEATPAVPASGAPEAYDFRAPEGGTLDPAVLESATPIFKELGLSQDAAQKLVDFYTAQTGKINADLVKSVETMRAGWREAVMKDADLGSKLDSVKTELGRAKDRLSPEVRTAFDTALNETGMGDHPAIVKALYEFSKLVNEGTHVTGGAPSPLGQNSKGQPSRPTIAGALYPNLPQ